MSDLQIASNLALPIEAVTETFAVLAKRGKGKALALDTPLPTPTGWTTMGDVQVGDALLDDTGRPCSVTFATEVQQQRTCYRIEFADGSSIVADAEHRWVSHTLAYRRALGLRALNRRNGGDSTRGDRPQCTPRTFPEVVTTEQMRETLRVGFTSGRRDSNHAIPTAGALQLPEIDLPIDPYLLGAWLGDGASSTSVITTADHEVVDAFTKAGYSAKDTGSDRSGRARSYYIGAGNRSPLRTSLRAAGVLNAKHVPAPYLRGSAGQRLALLQGLMDTDGTIGQNNVCTFTNCTEALADAVHELAVSLGWVARRRKRPARLNGIEHGVSHEVRFRPDATVFRIERKAARQNLAAAQASRHTYRMVTAIEPVPSVPVRCLTVDSASHLFLAGAEMVPTHNTSTAVVMAEEMIDAGMPVIVIDPVGVWWGLRAAADGTGKGLPVVIFGGDHADVPLQETAGEVIADVLVAQRFPAVLDLSSLSKSGARRFMGPFLERLYHRNRDAVHVIVDEADAFAPQRTSADGARVLGAMEDLVRRGRARGIGCTLITQRPAVIHKDVLTQAEVLIALGMTGPRDIAAIDEWVRAHADEDQAREVKASLAALPVGHAWVWSPGWLDILQRVVIRPRRTFDSSRTPKPGERRVTPTLAAVDLAALGQQIEATVEQAKATDPKALRQQVADLQRELAAARDATPDPERVEVPVLSDDDRRLLGEVQSLMTRVIAATPDVAQAPLARPARPAADPGPRPAPAPASPRPNARADLSKAQRAILTVLRTYRSEMEVSPLALLAGYTATGGGFRNALSGLRTAGYIDGRDPVTITTAGADAIGPVPPLPRGAALREHWKAHAAMGKAHRLILDCLAEHHDEGALSHGTVAHYTGYEATGGGFRNALSRLRTLGLIEGDNDNLRISPALVGP